MSDESAPEVRWSNGQVVPEEEWRVMVRFYGGAIMPLAFKSLEEAQEFARDPWYRFPGLAAPVLGEKPKETFRGEVTIQRREVTPWRAVEVFVEFPPRPETQRVPGFSDRWEFVPRATTAAERLTGILGAYSHSECAIARGEADRSAVNERQVIDEFMADVEAIVELADTEKLVEALKRRGKL